MSRFLMLLIIIGVSISLTVGCGPPKGGTQKDKAAGNNLKPDAPEVRVDRMIAKLSDEETEMDDDRLAKFANALGTLGKQAEKALPTLQTIADDPERSEKLVKSAKRAIGRINEDLGN